MGSIPATINDYSNQTSYSKSSGVRRSFIDDSADFTANSGQYKPSDAGESTYTSRERRTKNINERREKSNDSKKADAEKGKATAQKSGHTSKIRMWFANLFGGSSDTESELGAEQKVKKVVQSVAKDGRSGNQSGSKESQSPRGMADKWTSDSEKTVYGRSESSSGGTSGTTKSAYSIARASSSSSSKARKSPVATKSSAGVASTKTSKNSSTSSSSGKAVSAISRSRDGKSGGGSDNRGSGEQRHGKSGGKSIKDSSKNKSVGVKNASGDVSANSKGGALIPVGTVTAAKENSLVLFGEKSPVPANEAKVKSADQLSLNPSDMPPDIRFMMLMAKLMSKRKKEIDEYLEDDNTEHEIGANFNSRRLPRSIPALLRMQDELSNRIKEESVKAAESKKKADVHEAESIENAAKASWWSSIGPSITSFVGVAKEALKAAGVGIGFALGGPVGAALVGAIELAIAGVCACCSKQRSIDQAKNKLDAAKENYNAGVTQSSVAKLNSQASEIGAQIGMVNNLFSLATQAYNFMVGVMQAVIASAHEMRSKIAGGIGR